jgi:putative salt-induced outer membrane protein YdiY
MRLRTFPALRFLSLCAALLLTLPACAIVNVEQAIIGKPSEGPHASVSLLASGASGNTNTSTIDTDALGLWQHGADTEYLQLQYAFGRSEGQTNTDRAFAHLRHRTDIGSGWGVEGFVQTGRDRFARMAQRSLIGGAVRRTLFEETGKSAGYLGLGAFYERELLNAMSGTTDQLDTRLWRVDSYLILKRQINDQLHFSSTTYYQPAISDMADYRLLEQALLRVKLGERLDLKMSLEITFDSRPAQTVQKRDVVYSTGLEFSY